MRTRREFLRDVAGGVVALGTGAFVPVRVLGAEKPSMGPPGLPSGTLEESVLATLPGKRPLIKRTFRPPNYETPIEYFGQVFTPNDAFFVRYHLATIPEVAAADWKLEVSGEAVESPVTVSLD
jgi:DMSO/TMAO reductase YedYZ molybdopterin-dependent catalytic subunit